MESELWFSFDGHGSTRVLLDVAGAIAQVFAYDAYGQAIGFDPAAALTEFLYSGEQFDAKIGQQYLRQRYYDPSTGRFNRLDPFFGNHADPQSFHKYAYVHGDPIQGIDPSGESFAISMSLSSSISARLQTGFNALCVGMRSALQLGVQVLGNIQGLLHTLGRTASANPQVLQAFAKVAPKALSIARTALNIASRVDEKRRRDGLPIHLVLEGATKEIYQHTIDALAIRPDWYVLTYNNKDKNKRRYEALKNFHETKSGHSRDEFPYAITVQGGEGASVRLAPVWEQNIQRNQLRFLAVTVLKMQNGRSFLVLPVGDGD